MAVLNGRKYAAILCSSALGASILMGSSLPGATAAPAVTVPFALPADQSDTIPSESDIAAAKKSESDAKATQSHLEGLIGTLAGKRSTAITASMQANDAYTNALLTLKAKQDAATAAKAKSEAAKKEATKSRKDLGTLASSIYKNGGVNPVVESVLNGDGDLLSRATTLDTISQKQSQTFNQALASDKVTAALANDATAAQKAADDAARDADQARSAAETAQSAATQALASAAKDRDKVIADLASLRNTTVALETQRVQGLEQQQAAAALKALQERAAQQAVPQPQTPQQPAQNTGGGTNTGNQPAPQQPSVPQPPAPQPQPPAPQPPAPQPPAPQPPAPQPPAPQPPAPQPPAPQPPAPSPSPGSGAAQTAIGFAMSKLGSAYVWGGTGPGYDCSGLTSTAFASAGVYMPRTATPQYFSAPKYVPMGQWQPGDLIFWGDGSYFYHVAIYIGGDRVVQALNPSTGVTTTSIADMTAGGMALWPTAARYW
ncbi:NlpC/P60 family protein [Arthrobacter sp. NPDC090010]|uniref:C40 family peptidase n=1 Tax=Arthrobacter sp. NPDC090010 TaxID=3363942 RepID=UPI00381425A4